jgi:RNA polymerase sigma-32 factor
MTYLIDSPKDRVAFDTSSIHVPGVDVYDMMRRKAAARVQHGNTVSDTSALDVYMNSLRHVPLLTPEEQQELAERYFEDQDLSAGKTLIWTNLRLVIKMAREHARRYQDLPDLIQEGNVGLAEALTRYNPYRGVRFTGYAQYWVRAMMLNYLMNQLHPVRLGGSRAGRKLFYNLKKARRALIAMGEEPTPERVAAYLEVDEQEVILVGTQLDKGSVYLDAPASRDEETGTTIGDMMAGEWPCPEQSAMRLRFVDQLRGLMTEFGDGIADPRKRAIWKERMVQEEPKQLADLGADFDVSKERIRQLELEVRDDFKYFLLRRLGPEVEQYLHVD